jgi:NAD-dependent deacetylase sirtuin 1
MFIKFLEDEKKLLRNYTQNIDTLERLAGITKHVECHGSFGSATCLQCDKKYSCDEIRKTIYEQKVARCQECGDGLIKPDIVFFGENLPDHFHMQMAQDKDDVDLLVVIGSSLQVQPVSLIPYNIDDNIPQILINKEDLSSYSADIKLIGDCDSIIVSLCMAIGGKFKDLMLNGNFHCL